MTVEESSFVVPLTHLQRRPGNMWEADLSFKAPNDMGVALAHVDPDSYLHAEVRLESVLDGVLASVNVDYSVNAECARCLEPLEWQDSCEIVELYLYPETDSRGREVPGAAADSGDGDSESITRFVQNDSIDLEEVIRDAIVLDLPLKPLCDPGCEGLCPTCGEKRESGNHDHQVTDPRWAALEAFTED
jgi:uncharacterized protein